MHGGKQFFAVGVVYNTYYRGVLGQRCIVDQCALVRNERNRYGVLRNAVQEVSGAVQGVYILGGGAGGLHTAFFGTNAQVWRTPAQVLVVPTFSLPARS